MKELGFEGANKLANSKYHDRVYDHLPAWKKKQRRQQAQAQAAQNSRNPPDQERQRPTNAVNFAADDQMSSYAPSYAPDGRQGQGQGYRDGERYDYRDDRGPRYVRDESAYFASPNPGAIAMRDNEAYGGAPGYGATVRQSFPLTRCQS